MCWELMQHGEVIGSLHVPAEFLDWLRPRVTDTGVSQMDPYSDTTLEAGSQNLWLKELRQVWSALRMETRGQIERNMRLPSTGQAREAIAGTLLDREIRGNAMACLLRDLIAALELALDGDAVIRVIGD